MSACEMDGAWRVVVLDEPFQGQVVVGPLHPHNPIVTYPTRKGKYALSRKKAQKSRLSRKLVLGYRSAVIQSQEPPKRFIATLPKL